MIWLVARREIVERTRERSFFIGTLVTIAIVAAVVVLPSLFGGSGAAEVRVRAVGPEAMRIARAAAAADKPFDVRIVLVGSKPDITLRADGMVRQGGTPPGGVAALQAASARLRQIGAGVDPKLLDPPPLPVRTIDANAEDRQGFAFIALIVLYGQLITYGIWVAMGVVEEKMSRIVEILLATIRPRELLTGKVLGIGIVGLAQLLLIGAVGLTSRRSPAASTSAA